ncbi:PhzF family phenazine biosynthesis protein [Bacillus sp. SCS-151]|uniref:PhzF family phenazine biosynthesis protein n=1 Tax=Nanhaiella sioensis TaxID=3115293 RepID=UPI003978B022
MQTLHYTLIDVFTNQAFGGNQLAVFKENGNLSTEMMQKIARELNLSETVFMRPSRSAAADKELRIFTPQIELPIAGHPTIGAGYVLGMDRISTMKSRLNQLVFETGVGNINVTVKKENDMISFVEMNQKTPVFGPVFHNIKRVAELLAISSEDIDSNLPIQSISTGVPFLLIPIRTLSAMERISLQTDVWNKFFSEDKNIKHIYAFTTETIYESSDVHSRMFAPAMGITEDPATGNANGPLGAYLVEYSVIPKSEQTYKIRNEQGIEMKRPSFIDISISKKGNVYENVSIGGSSVMMGSGQLVFEV